MITTMTSKNKGGFCPAILNSILLASFFVLICSLSFSQSNDQGELLDNMALEKAIGENRKNGLDSYQNLFTHFSYDLNLTGLNVSQEDLLKKINAVNGVMESFLDISNNKLVVVSAKTKANPVVADVKYQLFLLGVSITDVSESTYKKSQK